MINSNEINRDICENCDDAEKILLEAMESDDEDAAYETKLALIQLYGTGQLMMQGADSMEFAGYTPEIIERIWLALTEKGQYAEFLLSLYQFGCAKITNCFGEYDVVLPALQNADKASALAAKHGIRLLSVPAEINPK